MQLVEQTIIDRRDPCFQEMDQAAFAAKNLYNTANYLIRQSFIFQGIYLDNVKVFHHMKTHEAYRALPAKVSNSILIQLHKAWVGFFQSMEEWKAHPEKFLGRPKLPKYKHKEHGRFLLTYDTQAIGMLRYKGELVGIVVATHEESYTSQASFLDLDPIPTYSPTRQVNPSFSGKRIARSWYRASDGRVIHADVNGSYNVLRKSSSDPSQLGRGVAGVAVLPRRLAV